MAASVLATQAEFKGLYGDECEIEFGSNQVSTTIIKGLTATKAAGKTYEIDGPLNYETTINNDMDTDVTNVVMQD